VPVRPSTSRLHRHRLRLQQLQVSFIHSPAYNFNSPTLCIRDLIAW
jgi:hypothetical protein